MDNYKTWSYRHVPRFLEEFENGLTNSKMISINNFREPGLYSREIRQKLIDYLKDCPELISAPIKRFSIVENRWTRGLSLFSDSEVIFDNFIIHYLKHDASFVLPTSWYEIVSQKNFKLPQFELNLPDLMSPDSDLFETSLQTFDEYPNIKKYIVFK